VITITVSYATPEKQVEIPVIVEENCTLAQAIALSGIENEFPEIKAGEKKGGIFGKCVDPESVVKMDDRVEIYRALQRDPKELRRMKISRQKT
jgi:hypothetical protein